MDYGGNTMTRRVIGRVVLGVWLGCFTAAEAAQLPPEILADRYLLRADRLMEAKDPKGALDIMGKIVALQKEHGLTFPGEFHFKYAKVALSAGMAQAAIDAVNTYLQRQEGKASSTGKRWSCWKRWNSFKVGSMPSEHASESLKVPSAGWR